LELGVIVVADWDVILAPATVQVRVILHEANTLMNSLRLINIADLHSGLGEWVQTTASALDENRKKRNRIVAEMVDDVACVMKAMSSTDNMTFIELIQEIEKAPVDDFREGMVRWIREKSDNYPGDEVVLASRDSYVNFVKALMAQKWAEKGHDVNEDEWTDRYHYIMNPQQLKDDAVEHLRYMWNTYLKAEWKRIKPTLQEAVEVFSSVDFSNMTGFEAIEAITGRNMRGKDDFEENIRQAERLTFVPSAHLGPYIGWGPCEDWPKHIVFLFGARLPKNAVVKSTALGRSELLVRLSALADETRLKILELLTQHEELCAQDFITELDLSQSSASRHLRQLTASGFLTERRRDVAKCYALNTDRIEDTMRALKDFLKKE
jgi:DNA-binding transcriptional ArsR family regulator